MKSETNTTLTLGAIVLIFVAVSSIGFLLRMKKELKTKEITGKIKAINEQNEQLNEFDNITEAEIEKVGNDDELTKRKKLREQEKTCNEAGGSWATGLVGDRSICNMLTTDEGRECSDESECQGTCLAYPLERTKDFKNVEQWKGKCSEWEAVLGCRYYMVDGIATYICKD